MEVDQNIPEVPFVPGGLRSLLTVSLTTGSVALDPRAEKWNAVLNLLELYFSNKEIKSILAQARHYTVPGTNELFGVPLGLIASFKSAKAFKASTNDITEVIQNLCPSAFEFNGDGSSVRRRVAFDQPSSVEALESMTRPASSGLIVEVTGFEVDVTKTEIKDLFEGCGRVRDVSLGLGGESGNEHAAFIDFESAEGMVKALAGYHVYEDSPLRLRAKPRSTPSTTHSAIPTGSLLPSLHSIKTTSVPIKSRGNASVQPSAVLGYPLNRILKVGPIPEDLRMTPALVVKAIEESLSRYGPVAEILFSEGSLEGHVRFKTPIAMEVEGFLKPSGGIEAHGEVLAVKALLGEEERILHEVLKSRTSSTLMDLTQTPATISKKRQKERQAASFSRRSRKPKKTLPNPKALKPTMTDDDITMAGPVMNENKKRPAVTQPEELDGLCEMMNLRSGRKIAAAAKKVKVEHVDSLFKNLTASS
ncbi:hypothetical protein HDU67_004044 [Dinochytrium kinnereticum]|nr:hypothetical protein HDU67_004044 [Dinochytrium kinnereticum]